MSRGSRGPSVQDDWRRNEGTNNGPVVDAEPKTSEGGVLDDVFRNQTSLTRQKMQGRGVADLWDEAATEVYLDPACGDAEEERSGVCRVKLEPGTLCKASLLTKVLSQHPWRSDTCLRVGFTKDDSNVSVSLRSLSRGDTGEEARSGACSPEAPLGSLH